ncbi:CU044_5270 family protein [Kitasatospora gansuensis]
MNREQEPLLPADRHQLLRGHLMSEISRENVVARKRPARRYGWVALPALAGGLALAVVLNTSGGGTPDGPSGAVAPVGAVQLLDRVAQVAAAKPVAKADGKFVYTKSLVAFASTNLATDETTVPAPHLRENWQSVDGKQPGLVTEEGWKAPSVTKPGDPYPANPDGSRPTEPNTAPTVNSPTYQFLATLPTDPDALLAALYGQPSGGKSLPVDQRAFGTIGDLLREQIAPPAVTAALYRAAAKLPGSSWWMTRWTPPAATAGAWPGRTTASGRSGSSTGPVTNSSANAPSRSPPAPSSARARCSPTPSSTAPASAEAHAAAARGSGNCEEVWRRGHCEGA